MTQDITLIRDKVLPSEQKLRTPPPVSPEPPVGTIIDKRYQIESIIASGGMARVYRGTHMRTGSAVAVKLIDPELSRDPAMKSRCLDEARAMMGIKSSHVVQASDVGELPNGQIYLVMEYLEGEDLDKLITREGPIPWPRAAAMAIQICTGLAGAHKLGIIHRDVKPQNCVKIEVDGNPDHIKLIDFGITKKAGGDTGLTKDGFILGTPEYMAPEFGSGAKASQSSDIYALGVTLYKLLTGHVPFKGKTGLETLELHRDAALVLPSARAPDREIPDEADQIVAIALAKQPTGRFSSVLAMKQALQSALGLQQSGLLTQAGLPRQPAFPTQPGHSRPSASPSEPIPASLPAEANSPTPAPTATSRIVESVTSAVRPEDERRLFVLRMLVLLSVGALFTMGTWLVSPPEAEAPTNATANALSRPTVPAASTAAKRERRPEPLESPPAPQAGPQEPVKPVVSPVAEPPPVEAVVDPGPSEQKALDAAPDEPVPPAEPEPTFPYFKAEKEVRDQLPFLRTDCMKRGKKPVSRLTFRIDVQPGGRSKVAVQSTEKAVRTCVKDNMSFHFDPSPRGGAFEFTVTETTATLRKVPVNPKFVQVPAP